MFRKLKVKGKDKHGNEGIEATVLDDDFTEEQLAHRSWWASGPPGSKYAGSRSLKADGYLHPKFLKMHRMVYEHYQGPIAKGHVLDHIDRNTMNNIPDNLRAVTQQGNLYNCELRSDNKSGYVGVSIDSNGRWRARARIEGKEVQLGAYATKEEAAAAVDGVRNALTAKFLENDRDAKIILPEPRLSVRNTSGHEGVSFHKHTGLWRARIQIAHKVVSLGYHHTPEEAALAIAKFKTRTTE